MNTQTFSLFSLILGVFLTSFKHFYKKNMEKHTQNLYSYYVTLIPKK